MKAQFIDVPEAEYHVDKLPGVNTPTLNHSAAHTLLSKSPAHCFAEHPRLGATSEKKITKEMDRGKILHQLLLGKGPKVRLITQEMGQDFRSTKAREARDEAYANGIVPMLEKDYAPIIETATAISRKLEDAGIDLCGESEKQMLWQQDGVACRGCIDHLIVAKNYTGAVIYDLKLVYSAHPNVIQNQVIRMGHYLQLAAYESGLVAIHPELAGRVKFALLCAEPEPPHDLVVFECDGLLRKYADLQWQTALSKWKGCLATGNWPGYATEPVMRLSVPKWCYDAALVEAEQQFDEEAENYTIL